VLSGFTNLETWIYKPGILDLQSRKPGSGFTNLETWNYKPGILDLQTWNPWIHKPGILDSQTWNPGFTNLELFCAPPQGLGIDYEGGVTAALDADNVWSAALAFLGIYVVGNVLASMRALKFP
jgi:hypothetical protein